MGPYQARIPFANSQDRGTTGFVLSAPRHQVGIPLTSFKSDQPPSTINFSGFLLSA